MSDKSDIITRKEFHQAIRGVRNLMSHGEISDEEAYNLYSWILGNYAENHITILVNKKLNSIFTTKN